MRKRVVVIVAALVCVLGTDEAAQAAVMCRNKLSSVVTVRSKGCKRGEAKIDIAQLLGAGAIAGDKLAGGIGGDKLVDGAITGGKLADGAVTEPKLAAGVAPKFLSLNVFGAHVGAAAILDDGFGPNPGLRLVDVATAGNGNFFSIGFTVPPDYTPATPLVARFLWHTNAVNCVVDFRPGAISVARAGRTHLIGSNMSEGLAIVGGTQLIAPGVPDQSSERLMTITSPVAGENLAPGDAINFIMARTGNGVDDTCAADMVIQGLSVEYQ